MPVHPAHTGQSLPEPEMKYWLPGVLDLSTGMAHIPAFMLVSRLSYTDFKIEFLLFQLFVSYMLLAKSHAKARNTTFL